MAAALQTDADHHKSMVSYEIPEIRKNVLRCKRMLGEGGFGEVYKAHHEGWSEDLAVKVCKHAISEENRRSVMSEIQRMVKTTINAHIVSIRGIVTDVKPHHCCIVMDYMEHGSLLAFQNKLERFPNAIKVKFVYEITLGMNFLHTQKEPIIHRDLKLQNILVNEELKIKISDFGLATWCTASNFNKPGGTITHIPPENLEDFDAEATTKYDVYSFGISLWQLLSRQEPFENCHGNEAHIKISVMKSQRPRMKKISDDEPDILKELIMESWQQEPEKRPEFNELNRKVHQELQQKYKKDVNGGLADIYRQLDRLSSTEDESDKQDHFPWEQNPDMTHTDARSRVFDLPSPVTAKDDPQTLQSEEVRRSREEKLGAISYPVAVSDTQNEEPHHGASLIEEKMRDMNLNGGKYGVPDTMPHAQATPLRRNGNDLNKPEDQVGVSSGPDYYSERGANFGSSIPLQPEMPRRDLSNPGGPSLPGQPYLQHPQQTSKRQSYSDSVFSSSSEFPPSQAAKPKPTGSSANSVNINVKGNDNVVSVASGGCTINVSKKFGRTNQKKQKRKKRPPPPSSSSSSSSDEFDSTASEPQSTSLTTSNEPLTESDIRDISEDVGIKHRELGRRLRLKSAQIENIYLDHEKYGHQEVAFQIMLKWIRSKGSFATKAELAAALDEVGLRNVAEKL